MTTGVQQATGRDLIHPALFDRLTHRITVDHSEIDTGLAERIVDQALAFLGTCATATQPIGPSPLVDIGWHMFILHTAEYAAFCDRLAGRFIHHEPDDEPGYGRAVPLAATVQAMARTGYRVDFGLWAGSADCTQCHAGCTDSPSH